MLPKLSFSAYTYATISNPGREIYGYQPQFEELFREVYELSECDLEAYFNDVQIQQVPRYAYGEEIAVLTEQGGDRLSLAGSYEAFTVWLTSRNGPFDTT